MSENIELTEMQEAGQPSTDHDGVPENGDVKVLLMMPREWENEDAETPAFPDPWLPDIAIFIGSKTCTFDPSNSESKEAVKKAAKVLGPNGDSIFTCDDLTLSFGRVIKLIRIGLWSSVHEHSAEASAARERGIIAVHPASMAESTIGMYVNTTYIRKIVAQSFAMLGGTINEKGEPDPSGHINLYAMSLTFLPPDRAVLRVNGFDTLVLPPLEFEISVTEIMSITGSQVAIATATKSSVSILPYLALATLNGIFTTFEPFHQLLSAVFTAIAIGAPIIVGTAVQGSMMASPLATIAANVFKPEIYLGPLKLAVAYKQAAVVTDGIRAIGTWALLFRTPKVTITGPENVTVYSDEPFARRTFSAVTQDLQSPVFTWFADGVAKLTTRKNSVAALLDAGDVEINGKITRRIRVTAVDSVDGTTASEEKAVDIYVKANATADPCTHAPWLDQCQ